MCYNITTTKLYINNILKNRHNNRGDKVKYIKKVLGSYNLHMLKTNRFKTITIDLIFRKKIKKEDITKRNVLADLLTFSSKKYPTRREMAIHQQDLYACEVDFSCYRLGNYYNTDISLLCLNEKYTEKGMLDETIKYLSEIVFNPNVTNNKFDSTSFEIIKNNTIKQIHSIEEDTRKYSLVRMLENMGEKETYSLHGFGYLEDLENINEENIYEYYQEFIKSSGLDIFIIGDIDFEQVEKLFKDNFKFNIYHKKDNDFVIKHDKTRKIPKKILEDYPSSQSKLSIGCKIKGLTDFERNYALTIFNMILGGSSESKLFRNVREKNSLCYYISSNSNKIDNLLFITSGITKNNFDKVIKLIKKEINGMKKGNFTQEEIEKAKVRYVSLMDEMYDYPSQIISYYYAAEILNSDLPEERKKMIDKVTKEDIINVSNKIYMDTIYLLGGEDDE